jgi:hypothetical protein
MIIKAFGFHLNPWWRVITEDLELDKSAPSDKLL